MLFLFKKDLSYNIYPVKTILKSPFKITKSTLRFIKILNLFIVLFRYLAFQNIEFSKFIRAYSGPAGAFGPKPTVSTSCRSNNHYLSTENFPMSRRTREKQNERFVQIENQKRLLKFSIFLYPKLYKT